MIATKLLLTTLHQIWIDPKVIAGRIIRQTDNVEALLHPHYGGFPDQDTLNFLLL